MKVKNYQELIVWQRAMDLVEEVYTASKGFPREELYGLTSQLRRAAISIPSNVAEGQGDVQLPTSCAIYQLRTDHCERLKPKY